MTLLPSGKAREVRGPKPSALCGHQDVNAPPLTRMCLGCLLGTAGLWHCRPDSGTWPCLVWTVKVNANLCGWSKPAPIWAGTTWLPYLLVSELTWHVRAHQWGPVRAAARRQRGPFSCTPRGCVRLKLFAASSWRHCGGGRVEGVTWSLPSRR